MTSRPPANMIIQCSKNVALLEFGKTKLKNLGKVNSNDDCNNFMQVIGNALQIQIFAAYLNRKKLLVKTNMATC